MVMVDGHPLTVDAASGEDELVRRHLALVHQAVSRIRNRIPRHVPREDLVSAGMAGLAQAARSFNPDRGTRFDRYASTRIRGAILDELRGFDWASRSVRSDARRVLAATEELTAKLGREPSGDEISGYTGMAAGDVRAVARNVERASVLHFESIVIEEVVVAAESASPEARMLEKEEHRYLADAVTALPERLRHVVISYFFEDRPMQEIAEELGVTQSRISQMRGEALDLMRHGMNGLLTPEEADDEAPVGARLAKRKAAYRATVASLAAARSPFDTARHPLAG